MQAFSLEAWVLLPFLCLILTVGRSRPGGQRYPGPKPWPVIGNVLPKRRVWLKLAEYAKTYGPIYSLRVLRTPMLVLNDAEAARSLLEEKSTLYANRNLPKMVELCGMDRGVFWERNAARLREARELLHMVLQPVQLEEWVPALDRHVGFFLRNLAHTPKAFRQHLRGVIAGVAMQISHGHGITSGEDPYLEKANQFVENLASASLPGQWLVDALPCLAWLPSLLPGMGFKRKAREWNAHYTALAEEGRQMVKDQTDKGTVAPSLISKALLESTPGEHSEDIVMLTATQVYTGAANTIFSSLASFILLMLEHPDVQLRAQEEIDHVIGTRRVPSYEDRGSLPYIWAIMTEVFRLRPPINTVTRTPARDDVHTSYTIEKDTLVIVNLWAMLHDDELYPDPLAFKPERWLAKGGKLRQGLNANLCPLDIVFGFGPRICPGRHLALRLVFTTMVRVLAFFRISNAHSPRGVPIIPSGDYSEGGIACVLTCRGSFDCLPLREH
ncbi:cytochrome P450 [Trametes gibbosa]|nr:cytochrome P450 [Trametes gibbosa]